MIKKLHFLLILFTVVSTVVYAQPNTPPVFNYDPEVLDLIEQAKGFMANEDYEAANSIFRRALATKKTLPTEMSYFFAETLFVINQFQNSKNFVDKYIELAGKGGDYYDEAIKLQNLLNGRFEQIRSCNFCNMSGYRFVTCDNCNGIGKSTDNCYQCKGNGLTTCNKCIGRGVLISLNSLGQRKYESCDLCDSKGYLECSLCHGEKTLSGACSVCLGAGQKVSSQICNHEE